MSVFVRTTSGVILEMDVPDKGHALDRWNEAIEKGDLTVIPHAEWVTRPNGSRYLVVPSAEATEATPKKAPKAKTTEATAEVENPEG